MKKKFFMRGNSFEWHAFSICSKRYVEVSKRTPETVMNSITSKPGARLFIVGHRLM